MSRRNYRWSEWFVSRCVVKNGGDYLKTAEAFFSILHLFQRHGTDDFCIIIFQNDAQRVLELAYFLLWHCKLDQRMEETAICAISLANVFHEEEFEATIFACSHTWILGNVVVCIGILVVLK